MAKIIVIGAGIAGCTTAIELAKRGHRVVILEQNSNILQGTSAMTPGRMGLGYHYFDFNTAKFYMQNTVEFMKKYSDCFLGDEAEPYLRDGRYFIVKDSLVPLQDLMATYDAVSNYYEDVCQKDPSNRIFRRTHLHRALHPSEFEGDINPKKVTFAIQTMECLLDWKKFEQRLKKEIAHYPNISVKTGFKVDDITSKSDGKFVLISDSGAKEAADYVVNCTWQNIEFLNEKLGLGNVNSEAATPVTSRLKLLAEVSLPESLQKKNSMFFCVGPHAMFSNLGNAIGRITYAPVTNFGTTSASKMPPLFERWLTKGMTKKETEHYGQKIIDGVSEYVPAMKDSKIIRVIPGIVKSKGEVDIYDKNSPFHKRDYDGVTEHQIGFVENAAMKLFYCLGNAKKTADIIEKQRLAKEDIREIMDAIMSDARERKSAENSQFDQFFGHLQKNFTSEYFSATANESLAQEVQKFFFKHQEEQKKVKILK